MFDIITSFEVLEHINNPNDEISNFKKFKKRRISILQHQI